MRSTRNILLNIFGLLLLSYTLNTSAKIQQNRPLSKQQKTFLAAEKAIKQNDFNQYRTLKKQLSHYPLLSYLEFEYLSKNLTPENQKAIDRFLGIQQDSPLAPRLKARYINALVEQKHYALFSKYYKDLYDSSTNAKYKCLYLKQQLTNGIPESQVLPKVGSLWNVSKSQDKACDLLFNRWKQAGYLSKAIGVERFNKAARKGPLSMIRYLKRYLPKRDQYLAKLWIKVRKDPGVVNKARFFPGKNRTQEAAIAAFAVKNLAWGDRDAAYKVWRKVNRHILLPKSIANDVERTLFLALATENNAKALPWAKRYINHYLHDELVTHWKLATFLRAKKWALVKEQYELLSEKLQSSNQYRYWYAEAYRQTKNKVEAEKIFKELALERDYYGFKAATRLKLPLQLNHKTSQISKETIKQIKQMAHAERAKELLALERYIDANREWRVLIKRMANSEQLQAAAKVAYDWGWYNQGILTIAKAKIWDDTNIRFPTAFKYDYEVMGKKVGLPPEWLMGVTRQESAYGPYAVSGAGAYGLMQVLPSTAKIYSKKFDIEYHGKQDLFNPDTNIEVGSHYLKLRYEELNQNPIYASAAYNAGKHRIEKWKEFGRFPTEIWIESIPYTETRDYIKKVMTYRAIYAMKLDKKDTVFDYILTTYTGVNPVKI